MVHDRSYLHNFKHMMTMWLESRLTLTLASANLHYTHTNRSLYSFSSSTNRQLIHHELRLAVIKRFRTGSANKRCKFRWLTGLQWHHDSVSMHIRTVIIQFLAILCHLMIINKIFIKYYNTNEQSACILTRINTWMRERFL